MLFRSAGHRAATSTSATSIATVTGATAAVVTTGAVGAMTFAVMTRASLGHTGRPKQADRLTVTIYILVNLGALLRVFGPAIGLPTALIFGMAAAAWSGAYLLFAARYGPYLIRPALDE